MLATRVMPGLLRNQSTPNICLGRGFIGGRFRGVPRSLLDSSPNSVAEYGSSAVAQKKKKSQNPTASAFVDTSIEDQSSKTTNAQDGDKQVAPNTASNLQTPVRSRLKKDAEGELTFDAAEIERARQWLDQDIDKVRPYKHLSPHQLLSLEHTIALRRALHVQRIENLHPAYSETERRAAVAGQEACLRVFRYNARKKYGVRIVQRVNSIRQEEASHASARLGDYHNSTRRASDPAKHGGLPTNGSSRPVEPANVPTSPTPVTSAGEREPGMSRPRQPRARPSPEWLEGTFLLPIMGTGGHQHNRISFHSVFLKLPQNVVGEEAVFVRCELAEPGDQHTNYFALDSVVGDPVRRLGVHLAYRVRTEDGLQPRTHWAKSWGLSHARKADRLVRLLDQAVESSEVVRTDDKQKDSKKQGDPARSRPVRPGKTAESRGRQTAPVKQERAPLEVKYEFLEGTVTILPHDIETKKWWSGFKAPDSQADDSRTL